MITLTEQNEVLIKKIKYVMVLVTASWAGDFVNEKEEIEQATKYITKEHRVLLGDIDANKEFMNEHGITRIPSVMFFKDGELEKVVDGSMRRQEIIDTFKELKNLG